RTHRPIRRLIAALLLFELVLVCIHVGGRMAGVDHNIVRYWFDLNGEQNIPAWFSGQLLFAVGMCWAIMAWLNRARPDRGVICAVLMTAIFMYFSVDEMVGIHERIAERIDGE